MMQSRIMSLRESVSNTAIGFVLSLVAQYVFLPIIGVPIALWQNFAFAVFMTLVSVARGYVVRRWFEKRRESFPITPFVHAVLAERARQISGEGYSGKHDEETHAPGDLALAGAAYGFSAGYTAHFGSAPNVPSWWPWRPFDYRPHGYRRDLVRGAALYIAEGELTDRNRKPQRAPTVAEGPGNPDPITRG